MEDQYASAKLRLESFNSWTRLTPNVKRQLAFAGFVGKRDEVSCFRCPVTLSKKEIDENFEYSSNYFRQIHRKRVFQLKQRCSFLLCQVGTNTDDLHQISTSTFDWAVAEYPEFQHLQTRLETFSSWPYRDGQSRFVNAELLAKSGFFFTDHKDAVTCFYCGNILQNWHQLFDSTNENIVRLEHARFFPCRFILNLTSPNFVKLAEFSHQADDEERRIRNPMQIDENCRKKPENLHECFSTFENWPQNAPICSKELAEAGFFYLGEAFRVQCYVCDLIVDEHYCGTPPLALHRQRKPHCDLVQAIDSSWNGDAHCVDEKWRLDSFHDFIFPFVSTKPTIEKLCQELAACGFYSTGKSQIIRCAFCAVVIEPNLDQSIMSQHRNLMKNSTTTDCPIVRAQCPTNRSISSRVNFPETRKFETVFARRQSFEVYQKEFHVDKDFIEERVYAGFYLENFKRMRCFQCGNALPIRSKRLKNEHPEYDAAKLHAHYYPTCEWVFQILGPKYVAQTLFDRRNSNRIENPFSSRLTSLRSEASSFPSPVIPIFDANFFDMSDYSEDSDDENYETIARPLNARFTAVLSPLPSPAPSSDQSPPVAIQPSLVHLNSQDNSHSISPIVPIENHPFKTLSMQTTPPVSPGDATALDDIRQIFASESNRLETFRKQNRTEFARLSVEELAYAGFYLNVDGQTVQCPWCDITLSEKHFETILRRRPKVPGSPLNDEPWTAMRVHRHAVGQKIDRNNSYCVWVRRHRIDLFPNQMIPSSRMAFPEYPSYQSDDKRTQSFDDTWPFRGGTQLSKVLVAHAGFIHLGDDRVICFYCGNALCEFKPRDCPFEEHAISSPLCDFIIDYRGQSFVDDTIADCDFNPEAKQRIDVQGTETIKTIYFSPTKLTKKKLKRMRVPRMDSAPVTSSSPIVVSNVEFRSISISDESVELCQLCFDRNGTDVFYPCGHYPMCEICIAGLTEKQRNECCACQAKSIISKIKDLKSSDR